MNLSQRRLEFFNNGKGKYVVDVAGGECFDGDEVTSLIMDELRGDLDIRDMELVDYRFELQLSLGGEFNQTGTVWFTCRDMGAYDWDRLSEADS